jgi:hypothetical protein
MTDSLRHGSGWKPNLLFGCVGWASCSTFFFALAGHLAADQPIFNEMPRWDDGWGYQFIYEYRTEDDLLLEDDTVASGFGEEVEVLHLEGVYTWDKSIRMTVKIPFLLDAYREFPDGAGGKRVQRDEGIGDATVALPLKKYFNLDGRSGSWTLAPQVRIPLSGDDEYEVYDGEWGTGIGFGYETETFDYIFSIGASFWHFYGDEPFEAFAHLDVAKNLRGFGSSGHLKLENDLQFEDNGSLTLTMGPALYWKFTDTIHSKVSWKKDVSDRQGILDHGNGEAFKIGIGFVY